jgi:fructose-bisphosphate aldolase class I
LNGLPARLQEYKSMGATFAKWRAAFRIGAGIPTDEAIRQNAEILARYAKCCQDEGIVPMVEPEVMIDGTHSIETSKQVLERVLKIVFEELTKHFVDLHGLILKTSMVISGDKAPVRADAKTVAKFTTDTLVAHVPREVAGVVFLSGGQAPDEATNNLREIAKREPLPWQIAFSYSRALQNDALKTWMGSAEKFVEAQKVFLGRLQSNSLADQGL